MFLCWTDSGLVGLVQPMLWDYTSDLDVDRTGRNHALWTFWSLGSCLWCLMNPLCWAVSLLKKYHTAGLSGLWAASSFKGSTCVHTCVPSTQKHVDNHLQWLKVAAALPTDVHLKGIALTGWQRWGCSYHLSSLTGGTYQFSLRGPLVCVCVRWVCNCVLLYKQDILKYKHCSACVGMWGRVEPICDMLGRIYYSLTPLHVVPSLVKFNLSSLTSGPVQFRPLYMVHFCPISGMTTCQCCVSWCLWLFHRWGPVCRRWSRVSSVIRLSPQCVRGWVCHQWRWRPWTGELSTVWCTVSLRCASISSFCPCRRPEDESLFPGRRLAELIVDLNHLLKSDDICFFENSMWVQPSSLTCLLCFLELLGGRVGLILYSLYCALSLNSKRQKPRNQRHSSYISHSPCKHCLHFLMASWLCWKKKQRVV